MDIQKLLRAESSWLARQEIDALSKMLQVYDNTFAELRAKLESLPEGSYTANHYQAINAQLNVLMGEMAAQQSGHLGESVSQIFENQLSHEQNHWEKLERTFGDPGIADQFKAFTPVVPQRTIKALVMTQDIPIKKFTKELTDRTRMALAQSVAGGEGINKAVRRLSQIEGMPKNKARLQLIARMETSRSANQGKQEFIAQVNEKHPELELWIMVLDRLDKTAKTRNHWFSWAISGTVRNITVGEYFEVHQAAIALAKQEYTAITKRKTYEHGILFEKFSEGRRGTTIPAHYHDRAVSIGWRPSWGAQFGPVKHPQGPITDQRDGKAVYPSPDPEKPVTGNYDHEKLKDTKAPHQRHYLKSLTRSNGPLNTVVLGVDKQTVRAEIGLIKKGLAEKLENDPPRYKVKSKRVYGYHQPDNFHPESGPGFETLTSNEYSLLKQIKLSLKKEETPEERMVSFRNAVRGQAFRLEKIKKRGDKEAYDTALKEFARVMAIVKQHLNVKMELGR